MDRGFNIITEYPLWFLILCIGLGILYAGILYYRETKTEFPLYLVWSLAFLRTVTVAIIAFLLLNPMIITTSQRTEKPVIIFAQDNSMSIVTGDDSAFYRDEYPGLVNAMFDRISASYRVDKFTFGEEPDNTNNPDFSEKLTNISALFRELNDRYAGQNVGALILATDGIYNKGNNPLYSLDEFTFPVFPVALGDTNLHRDVILYKVNYNRTAFLDNDFPMEVIVKADKLRNSVTELTITRNDSVIFRRAIPINTDNFFEIYNLHLKAPDIGLQRYSVRLKAVNDEISLVNNSEDVFIEVLDEKQKILILARAPHPDISAIRQTLEDNKNNLVEFELVDAFNAGIKRPEDYNLILLHELPSAAYPLKTLTEKITQKKIPVLYISGKNSNLAYLNRKNSGITIQADQVLINEATPVINNEFTLFSLSQSAKEALQSFPPLVSPYGNSVVKPSASVLLFQKIGSVTTSEPMIVLNEDQEAKTGIVYGTGFWKWRLSDFQREGNHQAFDEIIGKIVQYLSIKLDKSLFRVYGKNNFTENENVEFNAELYNENYEPVSGQEISLSFRDSENKTYTYVFNNSDSAYTLDAGRLPVDQYTYNARVQVGNKILKDQGEFTVSPLTIEKVKTVADHNLLYNIAYKTSGRLVYPSGMNELADDISKNENIKSISYSEERYSELLNIPLLLVVLISLLAIEWFSRKRAGAY